YIKGILICLIAAGIHKSVYLPLLCILVSVFTNINFRKSIIWWGLSIILSLTIGSQIQSLFLSLGFDDRMDSYLDASTISKYQDMFSGSGFRWDFALYSVMPIILGYYILIKKGISNRVYSIILNTYILTNSFWIMVITAANSDRFAYLSWFLYPVVIAYPLLHLRIWTNQNSKVMNILSLYVGFTLFMRIVYYG
ncbi:MAG: EpsG family protein, partial [Muribaculum sp.]|nr:EpsG family protein [Muribaculum sp.]